jgi:hypothetical protein
MKILLSELQERVGDHGCTGAEKRTSRETEPQRQAHSFRANSVGACHVAFGFYLVSKGLHPQITAAASPRAFPSAGPRYFGRRDLRPKAGKRAMRRFEKIRKVDDVYARVNINPVVEGFSQLRPYVE